MIREELEQRAAKLEEEYNKLRECLVTLDEIETLEAEIKAKREKLEREIPKDGKPSIIINPPKSYVALNGDEIPVIHKDSVTRPNTKSTIKEASEAFDCATINILNRIYNKEVGGIYNSLGECPSVNLVGNSWHYNGWGELTKASDAWKTFGLGIDGLTNMFVSRKLVVVQIGNKFCCGSGASAALSAILRSVLWDLDVDDASVEKCSQLSMLRSSMIQGEVNNFRNILDFGLRGNNGYVVYCFIKILEHFEVRDILSKITFWLCPGKGARKEKE